MLYLAYFAGAIAAKVVFSRGKRAWVQYKSLKELRNYGEGVGCSYVPGEEVEVYRKRLIDLRNKGVGAK